MSTVSFMGRSCRCKSLSCHELKPPVFARGRASQCAGTLNQVLRQFGELPQDLVDMQKYAAWKAADINKALREGRQPTPGSASSPIVPAGAHDTLTLDPRSAAAPDFAFPSAPAKVMDAPGFPSSTSQCALCMCRQPHHNPSRLAP